MTNDFVLEALKREFPESIVQHSEPYGMLTVEVRKNDAKKIIHHLKDSSLNFHFLTDVTGIHFPENPKKELGVIYHLHNMPENTRLRIKALSLIHI